MKKFTFGLALTSVFISSMLFNSTESYAISQPDKKELVEDIRKTINNRDAQYEFKMPVKANTEGKHILEYVNDLVTPQSLGYDSSYYLLSKTQISVSNGRVHDTDDIIIKMSYYYDTNEYNKYRSHIKELAKGKQNLSFDEKVKFVNDYLVDKSNYDRWLDVKDIHNSPIAILKEGTGESYAYALFAYDLLKELGVESYLLEGKANGLISLWNVLKDPSGNLVHLDVTLNDASSSDDFLMVSTETISKSHTFEQTDLKNITAKLKASSNPAVDKKPATVPTKESTKEKEEDKHVDAFKLSPSMHSEEFFENIEDVKFLGDSGKFSGNKVITLKFKERVGSTPTKNKKYFVADKDGNIMSVKISVANKIVRITNAEGILKSGVKYYLVMPKDVENDKLIGKHLKDTTYTTFSIK